MEADLVLAVKSGPFLEQNDHFKKTVKLGGKWTQLEIITGNDADSEILPAFSHVEPKFKILCASACVCLCEGERVTELEVKNK